jgi:AcrR family transcriptional regulator
MIVGTSDAAGRRPFLTREAVLEAAMRIADEEGIEALSMRKLARQLGGAAMSLYNHIRSKDDLLDVMIDMVFSEIDHPSDLEDWRSAMMKRALSARAALSRHRWAIGLMEGRTHPGAMTLSHHESALRCLRGAGFSVALTARALSAIDSYTYGFALQERALPFATATEAAERSESLLATFPRAQFPHLAEMTIHHVLQPGYNQENEYEFGLSLILHRLESLRSEGPSSP